MVVEDRRETGMLLDKEDKKEVMRPIDEDLEIYLTPRIGRNSRFRVVCLKYNETKLKEIRKTVDSLPAGQLEAKLKSNSEKLPNCSEALAVTIQQATSRKLSYGIVDGNVVKCINEQSRTVYFEAVVDKPASVVLTTEEVNRFGQLVACRLWLKKVYATVAKQHGAAFAEYRQSRSN